MRWCTAFLLGFLLASPLGGCSGLRLETRTTELAAKVRPRAVVVYPYRFRWQEPDWRAYQKSRDIVDAVLDDGRLLVFGPSEFAVYHPNQDNVLMGSNMLNALTDAGLQPSDAVVFRGWAEERIENATGVVFDKLGRAVGRTDHQTRSVIAHLDVIDVGRGVLLLEGHVTVVIDPFEEVPDTDPLQVLTRANRALVKWALGELDTADSEMGELGATLGVNPSRAFLFRANPVAVGSAPPLREDPLTREVAKLTVFAYFDPELPAARLRQYEAQPGGAVVYEVSGDPAEAAGLQPADLITYCNDQEVTGPEVVLRALAAPGSAPIAITVSRGDQLLNLALTRD